MSFIPLLIATILYVATAAGFFYEGEARMALVYIGYTIANIGLLLISWELWKRPG